MTTRLDRAGAIEGRIDDENGDAMLNVQVQAVRRLDFHGHVTLRPSGRVAATNDLGRFRLFDLPAGEYYVVARHTSWPRAGEPAPRFGHAETYYPGSPALDVARVVVVRAGRDRRGVKFKLASCRLAALTVQPVDSTGVPLGRQAQLTLATLSRSSSSFSRTILPDGTRATCDTVARRPRASRRGAQSSPRAAARRSSLRRS